MSLFGLIKYLELVTVLIGSFYFRKYSASYLRFFVYLMWLVVAVEFVISILKQYYDVHFQNNFIYNILTSIQYVYFFVLYYKAMKTSIYKKWVLVFLVVFLLSVVVNFLWIQTLSVTAAFHSYTFTVGAILLIVTIGLFLVEILNSEKVLYFKRYLMFWISIGLFVFYTGIIPFVVSLNLLPAMLSTDSLAIIFFTLNLVMYICFSIGFILSHKYSGS